jgi:DNA polymerase III subunit chi
MTHIGFYQISQGETDLAFCCRLVDMVYRRGLRIHVHTGDQQTAEKLDELLWSFDDDRFIPHDLYGEDSPISIGINEEPEEHQQVLVNLSGQVPEFFGRFDRVAEIVPVDENSRQIARNNYRFYKDRGYSLEYHQIPAKPAGR